MFATIVSMIIFIGFVISLAMTVRWIMIEDWNAPFMSIVTVAILIMFVLTLNTGNFSFKYDNVTVEVLDSGALLVTSSENFTVNKFITNINDINSYHAGDIKFGVKIGLNYFDNQTMYEHIKILPVIEVD